VPWIASALVFALACHGRAALAAPRAAAIELVVDATDMAHRIIDVLESIPVAPGELTLWFPQWLPGNHAPRGPIDALAGLTFHAGDVALPWKRDPQNMYAFHLRIPRGADTLAVRLQFLSPLSAHEGRVMMSPDMVSVQWEKMLLYPAGQAAAAIPIAATLVLPGGWGYGTALRPVEPPASAPQRVRFEMTTLETLVDSPVLAGAHFRRERLIAAGEPPVYLNVAADTAQELSITPEQLALHGRLVQEAVALFGAHHFDHYDFLVSVSEHLGGIGLEHHRSSEDGVRGDYFSDWDGRASRHDLLAHELVHSWNGKFRRPADLWTPDYNVPMGGSLLWVYEGQTTYWGQVLAARSRLWSEEMARGALANNAAALLLKRQGRKWRSLQDTVHYPVVTATRSQAWPSWQRSADYYAEGAFIWLAADARIRELTGGRRSLDDFARRFFGVHDGRRVPMTYTFDDVARTLQEIVPGDWAKWLRERLDYTGSEAPLEGLAHVGWKLVFAPEPTDFQKKNDRYYDRHDFSYSVGVSLADGGKLDDVVWDSPAFRAGLAPGATLVAVNGLTFSLETLADAIRNSQAQHVPLQLLVHSLDRYSTVTLDYFDGLKYPHLERLEGTPDRLAQILRARVGTAK
jgi:predicted metalloprotease with PDZ domain